MYLRINSHVVSRGRLLEPYGPGLWFPVAFYDWTSDGDEAVMFHFWMMWLRDAINMVFQKRTKANSAISDEIKNLTSVSYPE